MNERNEEQIRAYIDGYNDCFDQFSRCLKNRKSLMDAVKRMKTYRETVNGVITRKREEERIWTQE